MHAGGPPLSVYMLPQRLEKNTMIGTKVFEIPSMIPVFVDELQVSYAQAGLFMTAYPVVRCLASLPAGSVTDRWGSVPVISACLLCAGVLTWVPVFLDEVYRYSPAEIGAAATMFGVAAIPASIVTGFLCTNLRRIVLLCVSGGVLAATGIIVLLSATTMPLWLTVAVITVITWGHSQVIVTIMSIAAMIVPTHSSGKALGVIFTFGYAGSILGSYSGGYLLERTGHYDPSFFLFSASAIISIIAMLAVSRILQKNPPAHFKLNVSS